MRFSRWAPYRDDIGLICDWLWEELARLGVERELGSRVDGDTVRAINADAVIVATGSLPRRDGVQRLRPALHVEGLDQPNVVTPLEVLGQPEETVPRPARAVVFDDLGNYQAVGSAEKLLAAGAEVVLATSFASLAPDLVRSFQRDAVAERLGRYGGFRLETRTSVERVTPRSVTLRNVDTDRETEVESDLLVLMTGFTPRRRSAMSWRRGNRDPRGRRRDRAAAHALRLHHRPGRRGGRLSGDALHGGRPRPRPLPWPRPALVGARDPRRDRGSGARVGARRDRLPVRVRARADEPASAPEMGSRWAHSMTSIGFLAGVTKTIELVCLVVLPYHNPLDMAKALATLDFLSAGRLVLLALVGYNRWEFQQLGVPFAERGPRTDEYLEAMLALWRGEPDFHGRFVDVQDVVFDPRPARDPIPIWHGGFANSALRRVARIGEGWITYATPRAQLPQALAHVRAQPEYQQRRRRIELSLPLFEGKRDPVPTW